MKVVEINVNERRRIVVGPGVRFDEANQAWFEEPTKLRISHMSLKKGEWTPGKGIQIDLDQRDALIKALQEVQA